MDKSTPRCARDADRHGQNRSSPSHHAPHAGVHAGCIASARPDVSVASTHPRSARLQRWHHWRQHIQQAPVSVTTYDSACIHMQDFGDEIDLVNFDECHHLPGQFRSDAARMSTAPYRLGLTATPERSDGREAALDSLIGPIVLVSSIQSKAHLGPLRSQAHPGLSNTGRTGRSTDLCSSVIRHFMSEQRKSHPNYSFIDLRKIKREARKLGRAFQAFYAKELIEISA